MQIIYIDEIVLSYYQINRWIKYGKDGREPFKQFYEYYEKNKIDPNKKIK